MIGVEGRAALTRGAPDPPFDPLAGGFPVPPLPHQRAGQAAGRGDSDGSDPRTTRTTPTSPTAPTTSTTPTEEARHG